MTGGRLSDLKRHQLAFIGAAAWARILELDWDSSAHDCIEEWSDRRLPLVVTRQLPGRHGLVSLGLPGPTRYLRRRHALEVSFEEILYFDAFPKIAVVGRQLSGNLASQVKQIERGLESLGCEARVFGSRGWQVLTGLEYVHSHSDIDLMIPVSDARTADGVCNLLADLQPTSTRFDGELVFGDGSAVAWREWQRWRAGQVRELMVKRLGGAALVSDLAWLAEYES